MIMPGLRKSPSVRPVFRIFQKKIADQPKKTKNACLGDIDDHHKNFATRRLAMNTQHNDTHASAGCISTLVLFTLRLIYGSRDTGVLSNAPRNVLY